MKKRIIITSAIVPIFVVLGSILIFTLSQRTTIPFYPSSVEIVSSANNEILSRFRLSKNETNKILNNSDKYYVIEVQGVMHNNSGTQICDEHINAEFKKPSADFLEVEYMLNESPAFSRTGIDEKTDCSVLLLIEADYYDSMSEADFIDSIEFNVSVLKYSDEKFSRVYG